MSEQLPETNIAPLPRTQEPRPLRRPCGCGKKREPRIARDIPPESVTPPQDKS